MCYKLFKPNYTQQHLGVDAAQFVHIVLHFVVCFESPLQFPENLRLFESPLKLSESTLVVYLWF